MTVSFQSQGAKVKRADESRVEEEEEASGNQEGTGTASGQRGIFLNTKRQGVVKGKHNVTKERKGRREADERSKKDEKGETLTNWCLD